MYNVMEFGGQSEAFYSESPSWGGTIGKWGKNNLFAPAPSHGKPACLRNQQRQIKPGWFKDFSHQSYHDELQDDQKRRQLYRRHHQAVYWGAISIRWQTHRHKGPTHRQSVGHLLQSRTSPHHPSRLKHQKTCSRTLRSRLASGHLFPHLNQVPYRHGQLRRLFSGDRP